MKKAVLLSVVFLTMILTTGCIKCSYDIEIDKDNNISVSETKAIDISKIDSDDVFEDINNNLDKNKSKLEELGYEVALYDENDYKGLTQKKVYKLDKFYNVDLPKGFEANTKKTIRVKSVFGIKDVYTIDWNYSFRNAIEQNLSKYDTEDIDLNAEKMTEIYESQPKAELVIKVPYKVVQNNATSVVGGKELHWNLIDEKNDNVHILLKYEKYNQNAIIGFLALIIAAVGFIILNKVLKRDDVVY